MCVCARAPLNKETFPLVRERISVHKEEARQRFGPDTGFLLALTANLWG